MIRLYNHTRYPDEILRTILTFAARCAGVQGDVPVKLTYSHRIQGPAFAHHEWPYRKTLIGKPTTSRDKRLLKCPIGWVSMTLARDPGEYTRSAAEWFVDAAIHEMAHIRQYRTGFKPREFWGKRPLGKSNRRVDHDDRPCEIDAENAVYDVKHNRSQNKRREFLIEQLALSMLDTFKPTSPAS